MNVKIEIFVNMSVKIFLEVISVFVYLVINLCLMERYVKVKKMWGCLLL